MSRTLFLYIFKDLFRIFLLTSGVLAAIMNFGGLLRPLYEYGLSMSEVGQILAYAGPAMTAYSMPIAALFATTIVYGRFGADNEVTACRAAGISYLAMTMPAFVLGLMTAFISIGLLSYVVPVSMLKVERIVYSNIARLAVSQIERTHQIRFDRGDQPLTVFATSAEVLPVDPARPNDQAVRFHNPVIAEYEKTTQHNRPLVPKNFLLAKTATAYIQQGQHDDELSLTIMLQGGKRFPRNAAVSGQDAMQVSVGAQTFGPVPLKSPVKENTKFMDFFRLRTLWEHPEQSRRINTLLQGFIRDDQERAYLQYLAELLNGPTGSVELVGANEAYRLVRGGTAPAEVREDTLVLSGDDESPARFIQTAGRQTPIRVDGKEIQIRAFPRPERKQIGLEIDMLAANVTIGNDTYRRNISRPLSVPMPLSIFSLSQRPVGEYVQSELSPEDKLRIQREYLKLTNSIKSEMHARMSFALSCLVLVMVGCALGMMFRSGDFLSAFAISVIPALLSIALIVTGQHTCENVPSPLPPDWHNSLGLGLTLIWSGNAAVCVIGLILLRKLHRQ